MKSTVLPAPLWGIVPPLATPLLDRDTLEVGGLERLIEHVLAGGVHGLFMLGTTGEGPSLSHRLRRELVDRAVRQVRGRVPVLVGITDTAFVESVALARHAADCGADAVVLAPPYYMPEAQPELREYLGHLLPEQPLPLFLYNMPPLTKVPYEVETVRWAMDQPRIVGLKDSSGDLAYYGRLCELLKQRPDWTLLIGPEELLAQSMEMGGHGGVPGGANLFPHLYCALFEAVRNGQKDRTHELQERVRQVSARLYHVGQHPSAVIKGIKCALACLGVCSDFMAEPFHRFRTAERARIQQAMKDLLAVVKDRPKLRPHLRHLQEIRALAESCARQLTAWTGSLESSPVQGKRHLTGLEREKREVADKMRDFRLDFLRNLKPGHPLYSSPEARAARGEPEPE